MTIQDTNFEQEWDVCIVGGGPAAIAVANELKGTALKVLILESAKAEPPEYDAANDALNEGQMGAFLKETWDGRRMPEVPSNYLRWIRQRGYGGTTSQKDPGQMGWNHDFGGWCRPLSAIDFARGWPPPLNDIQKLFDYYHQAQDFCGLGFYARYNDPAIWEKDFPVKILPPRPEDELETVVFNVIGTINGMDAREFQQTYKFDGSNVEVLRGLTAQYLVLEDNARWVKKLVAKSLEDIVNYEVKAKRFVLAMGCMENARFLLLSYKHANRTNDRVGEYFTTHPQYGHVAAFYGGADFTEEVRNFFAQRTAYRENYTFDFFACWVPTEDFLRDDELANFRFNLRFNGGSSDPIITKSQTAIKPEADVPESDRPYCSVGFAWEQVPNQASKITLDDSSRDAFGEPELCCDWQLTPEDKTTAQKAMKCLEKFLKGRIGEDYKFFMNFDVPGWPDDGAYKGPQPSHEMGTTRMSASGADGVVNADCRMHDLKNVYIAGSSVFPRVGWANPTLTIIALAIRLGEHLKSTRPGFNG